MAGAISFRIGVEVETTLDTLSCETCDNCLVCDECPVCYTCREYAYFCEYCNPQHLIEYLNIEVSEENICEFCLDNALWEDTICSNCERCIECQYVRNPEYCPNENYVVIENSELKNIIKDVYFDGSCGLELVTKTFRSVKELREALKIIVELVEPENMNPEECCGGHTNISFDGWESRAKEIAEKIMFFADLLTYMFCEKTTWERRSYKKFPSKLENLVERFYDKYTCVHIKDYAIEVRFPDSPRDADNHVLLSSVLLSLAFSPEIVIFDEYNFQRTKLIYEKINKYGEKITEDDKRYLAEKFKSLRKIIRPYLKVFSRELGVDLEKALNYRFKNPKYEDDEENFMNLDDFPLKQKTITLKTTVAQKTLAEFLS